LFESAILVGGGRAGVECDSASATATSLSTCQPLVTDLLRAQAPITDRKLKNLYIKRADLLQAPLPSLA
jgi:hypothetical protein